MNQSVHAWIAIRAIGLLEEEKNNSELVELLKPNVRKAAIGAWIPDLDDAKRGGASGTTDNHIFKIGPYDRPDKVYYITDKSNLLKQIGRYRMLGDFLFSDDSLSAEWWKTPYKGRIKRAGQHIPNRAMAMSVMLKDLLLMGDRQIDHLIPGNVEYADKIDPNALTKGEAATTYFFMLSHFIADASMPCHCDGRDLADYGAGLHNKLEEHWSTIIGDAFKQKNLLPKKFYVPIANINSDSDQILDQAKAVSDKLGLKFNNHIIPGLGPKNDEWKELVFKCRASFALSSIIAPPDSYDYNNSKKRAPFNVVFGGANKELLDEVDRIVLNDAVLDTAIIWKNVWKKVSKP